MDPAIWRKFYDPGVPAHVEFEDVTLPQWLERSAARYPDRTALIFANRKITYRELKEQVDRLAAALAQMGVTRETRVATMLPNLPQTVIGYYAIQRLGAVATPTNPLYTPREIEHQWNDAECSVAIVADFIFRQKIAAIRDRLPVKHYIVASIPEYLGFPLNLLAPLKLKKQNPPLIAPIAPEPGIHFFKRLVRQTAPNPPRAEIAMDDLSTLLYTGGTTGLSKGAMLTHRNLSYNVQQIRAWFAQAAEGQEVLLGALPFFHSYGLTVVMNLGIRLGGAIVLIPNPRDIAQVIQSVVKHRVTIFAAVPTMFQAITQYPGIERIDLSSIKLCNSGAAPLPVEVLRRFEELTGSKISEGFGLTETSPVTHCNPLYGIRKVGSIGIPLPDTEQKIVDLEEGTRELPPNTEGELLIRGPQVMKGYWKKPEETARMIRDGWLYTGDLARVDEDGYCYIVGRKKDMIICSGYNVYPDEIDRVLMAHPAVLEAATIGIPDPKRGETVKSFVVLKPGWHATEQELKAHCRQQLAPYKVPEFIEFRTELPKSTILKILRRELREQEMAKRAS
jgi:long-chain acyl-CoA synthetase